MRQFLRILLIGLVALSLGSQLMAQSPFDRVRPAAPVKGEVAAPPTGPGIGPEDSGGPDDFGYTYIDSDEPDGPTFSFFDISATGTPVLLADDDELSVPIGFSFDFYGTTYTDVFIVSNGFLNFDGGVSGTFTNDCPFAPGSGASTNSIAPYWDDLDPGDDGASAFFETFGSCPVGASISCMIVQWDEVDFFPGDGAPGGSAGTFQAILYADSSILFQYEGGPGLDGSSATVGISNDAAGNSLLYGCDSPGQIAADLAIEFGLGDVGDLEITKTGAVAIEGPFDYTIDVVNNGPEDQTGVVVTDTIPAELDFLSDSCGGSFDGTDWTWNIGNLANGQNVSCTLTVQLVDINTCVTVSNTATVTGDLADPSGNSSSTISNGGDGNAVGDPGFEAGPGGGTWTEASTNFGTPVCDVGTCGTGTGTGPFEGLFWTWFGGIGASEIGSMTQDITINPGSNEMTFWLEQIVCDSAADFMEVTIDGTQVFFTDGSSPLCGVLGYSQQTVDISAFADGGTHTLEFRSEIFANNGGGSNFFVDLVEIPSAPFCEISMGGDPDNPLEIPTLDTIGLVILSLLLAAGATWRMRRRNEI